MDIPLRRIILLLLAVYNVHAFIDDALDVLKLGKEIGEEVLLSWDVIGKPFNATGGVELPITRRREREILSRLAQVSRSIQRIELAIEKTNAVAILLAKSSARGARLELKLNDLSDLLSRINNADLKMREYVKYQRDLERRTLEDFAFWCVSHDPEALPGLLERVHSLLVPPHKYLLGRGLLHLVLEDLQEEHPDLCELQLSPHQLVYDMYNTISLTEIKGYAMMQFSWMLLRIYGKGNFTQEASLTRQRYADRTAKTAAAARSALAMARTDLYRCDPTEHIEGETYAEVTRLLQGYIENEVDMNPEKTCKDNCGYYSLAQRYDCYGDSTFCNKQDKLCNGRILDCRYIDSDMWICPASRSSHRRYEWIEYENGRTLGRVGTCNRGTTKVDSWWRWNLLHCSYCMCLCEDSPLTSDRFFSLKEAVSDMKQNKIVTGIRMVKLEKVFHLQVSEGTLGERGSVTPAGWVPVQRFDPSEPGVNNGIDYHQLTYEKRAVDLDELTSPEGSIMTGVRFTLIGAHLHFEIRSTPFNYTSGRLHHEKSQWISNDNTEGADKPRSQLELYRPDIPTRSITSLPVDSKHDQYVEFTNSDFEADAAQSTVPFVDIQPILPMKGSSMISGAGVIHKGARGSGGFLALKLFTYNYTRHVKAEAPPESYLSEEVTEDPSFAPIVN